MINGLDLFSGIGGLSIALSPWVRPIAYCENDRFAQSVLLSRMAKSYLPCAPIWDDIRTLRGGMLPGPPDVIYGGFPCQDISVAGIGAGLEGKRSGLVFEIFRLIREIKPAFVFLENVPAIRTRGGERVGKELAQLGYDCRWDTVSAQEIGAPHKRVRWFCLAYAYAKGLEIKREQSAWKKQPTPERSREVLVHPPRIGRSQGRPWDEVWKREHSATTGPSWWDAEPPVGRVVNGLPYRVDRLRGLGNAVVTLQARKAFRYLGGLDEIRAL